MMAASIELLRAFIPQRVQYGSNGTNGEWKALEDGFATCFIYQELAVLVLLRMNKGWGCHELIFMTARLDKLSELSVEALLVEAELLRPAGLSRNPNRATAIFRHVTYVALTMLPQIKIVGFNGAIPKLDRIYGRLAHLCYFRRLLRRHGFEYIIRWQRNVYVCQSLAETVLFKNAKVVSLAHVMEGS